MEEAEILVQLYLLPYATPQVEAVGRLLWALFAFLGLAFGLGRGDLVAAAVGVLASRPAAWMFAHVGVASALACRWLVRALVGVAKKLAVG